MNHKSFIFEGFELDPGEKLLFRNGLEVSLQPKAFDMLVYFAGRSGELVSHDELLSAVWPNTYVGESNIALCIHILRKTLGKKQNGDSIIVTVPKRGYRFNAIVKVNESGTDLESSDTNPAVAGSGFKGKSHSVSQSLIALLAIFFIGLTIVTALWQSGGPNTENESSKPDRLVVFPFHSVNDSTADFQLGLADEMITSLGKIKQIEVLPLNEVREFMGTEADALNLGRKLNVRFGLTGTYRIEGETVRVAAKLLSVSDGATIWDETISLHRPGRLNMEMAVAARIGRKLSLELGQINEKTTITGKKISSEAVKSYLAGRKLWRVDDIGRLDEMRRHFEKAVELAPDWSRSYSALAEALLAGDYNETKWDLAEQNARKALELDPNDEQAHTALAEIYRRKYWNWQMAEQSLKRAIEINPNYAEARNQYAILLRILRRYVEARNQIGMAIDQDRFSPGYHSTLCEIEYYDRDYYKALSECRYAQDLHEDYWRANKLSFWIYVQKEMYAEVAEQALRKLSPEDRQRHPLGSELNASSIERFWQDKMDRHLKAPQNTSYTNFSSASYAIRMGQNNKAFEYLEKSLAAHEEYLPSINGNPNFDAVRFDPRFVNIIESAGLQK